MSRLSDIINQQKKQIADNILTFTAAYPLTPYKEVARLQGCSEDFVLSVMKRAGIKRKRGPKPHQNGGR